MKRLLAGALALAVLLCALSHQAHAQAGLAGISPCAGGTLAVAGTSSNIQLSVCGPVVIVYNVTSQEAFYAVGAASTTAATAQTTSATPPVINQYSIPGNTYVVLNVNTAGAYLAAVTATSTTTLRIVQGYANP